MNDSDNKGNKNEINDKNKEKEKDKGKENKDKKDKKNNNDDTNTKNEKKNILNDLENVSDVLLEIDVDIIVNLLFKTDYRGKKKKFILYIQVYVSQLFQLLIVIHSLNYFLFHIFNSRLFVSVF